MNRPYRVLVIGGYGTFGRWVVESLAQVPNIQVWVGGRNLDQAQLCAVDVGRRTRGAPVHPLCMDATDPDLSRLLIDREIHLVVHTSGPFQGQDYAVAHACIKARCHYIDLADDRTFVAGIRGLNEVARTQGVALISGASSVPGLSSVVVDNFLQNFSQLNSIRHSISPGNQSPRGLATVKAILGYAGRSIERLEEGRWIQVYGWQDMHRQCFGELGQRWVAACDIPDLGLFPQHYSGVKTVAFHAGLELRTLHFAMWGMSWLARARIVSNWADYTNPIVHLSERFSPLGTDCGGMRVELSGKDDHQRKLKLVWTLIAKAGDGPHIPTIPAVVLAKKMALGEFSLRGAMPCLGLLTLEEFSQEIKGLNITQKVTRES